MSTTSEPRMGERDTLRRLTAKEQQVLRPSFPRLNFEEVYVRGERDQAYNCLAWTLGINNAWIWPWSPRNPTKAEFDQLYRRYGFAPAGTGSVAGLGLGTSSMRHGALGTRGLVSMPRWSSKLGQYLLIQHQLGQLEGGSDYGNVQGYYSKSRPRTRDERPPESEAEEFPAGDVIVFDEVSDEALSFVRARAEAIEPELRTRFEDAYAAWSATWEHPGIALSSNPGDYARSTEFLELVALGPAILPLLMGKLLDPDGFLALQAIERLGRPQLFDVVELDDETILGGEQARARQVLERWIDLEA